MSNQYWSADLHISHKNVIGHNNRPFSCIEEHDQAMIDNINNTCTRKDTLNIIGDFAWNDHGKWLAAIKCKKVLISGSHDRMAQKYLDCFTAVYDMRIMKHQHEILVMAHCPFRTWERSHYGSVLLHGHCHGRLETWNLSFDVGVDTHDYKPYAWDELKPMIDKRRDEMRAAGRVVTEDRTGKVLWRQDDVRFWKDKYDKKE